MSSHHHVQPLKGARMISLALAWAFGVIAGGVGLNALVKNNQSQTKIKHATPAPTVVTIDVGNIFDLGIVLTTGATLLAVLASSYFWLLVVPGLRRLGTKTLKLQAYTLLFSSVWVLACLIPFTYTFATKQATVTAMIGTIVLPATLVEQQEAALGTTPIYRKIGYLLLPAVLDWFTVLFGFIAAIVTLRAASAAKHLTNNHEMESQTSSPIQEKRSVETEEKGRTEMMKE